MRVKSPLRLIIAILVLLTLIYIGFQGAVSIITGQPIKFGFSSGSVRGNKVQDFVVAGVDDDGYRTDLILFCRYNMADNSINVLQIPRDTKVENDRHDKKINSAYGSPEKEQTLFDEIEGLIGIRPEKSVIVSFKAFREIIDAIGGVEIDVPIRMNYHDPFQNLTIDLYPGLQLLNGRRAEMFMRFRQNDDGSGYPNGDIDRVAAQKGFYQAVADKLLSGGTILKAPKIIGVITDNVKTDFTVSDMVNYLGRLPKFSMENVKIHTLPGEGGYDSNGVSYFFCDEDATKTLIKEHFTPQKGTADDEYNGSFKNRFIKVKIVDATGLESENADILTAVKETLADYGFKVVATEKSARVSDTSELINHNEKRAAVEVQKVYERVPIAETIEKYILDDEEKMADVTIKMGTDFSF